MGEVVNLRLARKARERAVAEAGAATRRAAHGRTKAQKMRDAAEADRLARTLDGARRED
jgi:hypothetical protein